MLRRSFAALGLTSLLPAASLGSAREAEDGQDFSTIDVSGLRDHKIAVVISRAGQVPTRLTIETSDDGVLTIEVDHLTLTCKKFSVKPSDDSIEVWGHGKAHIHSLKPGVSAKE